MLIFSKLSLRRATRQLLSDADFQIHLGQHVGLTGANGTGKSSLFAMIRGELIADEGQFSMPDAWVIAHVKQETPSSSQTALAYALEGDEEYTLIQQQLTQADGTALAELHGRLEAIDGYRTESRAATLLQGLGFTQQDLQRPVSDFSGGWRMRLNLAQALMCRSDLLLLDEPTNHLDLDAVIWLQDWLQSYQGTMLLISHDREFLDSTVGHIAHIEQGKIRLYTGNYSAFEQKRAEMLSQQQAAFEKQQREIKHIQSFVERFKAKATKAKQAQSRIKMLERMEVVTAAHIDSPFSFRFETPEKLPDHLFQAHDVTLGYGDHLILEKVRIQLQAGSRIGLIGPNGAGKSTLIKFIAGELAAKQGEVVSSQHLKMSYFAQHQLDQLQAQDSALDHMRRLDPKASEQQLRDYLGGFAFNNERIEEAIQPFSGGEKARLALAILVYQRPNVLLLDEPTNHLDLDMRDALNFALQDFAGALVVVSHDRHLLKTVTDELILVNDGKAVNYLGDLDDYADWLKQRNAALSKSSTEPSSTDGDSGVSKKQKRQQQAEIRKKLQPLKKAVDKLETQMERLEVRKQGLEEQLADSELYQDNNKQRLQSLLQDKGQVDQQWEALEEAWMEASEAYENALDAVDE